MTVTDDPVIAGTYDMSDEMEKIAKIVSVCAFKYFSSSATDEDWMKWRTKAKEWLATWGDEFPLQGLADAVEEILNEAYLFPVDYDSEDPEEEGTPFEVAPDGLVEEPHTIVTIPAGNSEKKDFVKVMDDPPLVCDFCQVEEADRFVPHLGTHFCRACYWANVDITRPTDQTTEEPHAITNSRPPLRDDSVRRSHRPDDDQRPVPDVVEPQDDVREPDTLSWSAFGTPTPEPAAA